MFMLRTKKQKSMHKKISYSKIQRSGLIIAACTVMLGTPGVVYAETYDQQIQRLQQEQSQQQAVSDKLGGQAKTIEEQINDLQNQIAAIQAQISANQKRYADLSAQIKEAEKELAQQKKVLGINIKQMYVEGDISTVEMLASSKNISEYLDKQQYRNSVKDKITETVKKIDALKKQLNAQKEQVTKLLEEQEKLKASLDAKRNEANAKLAQTQQEKSKFDQKVSELQNKIAEVHAAQLAAIRAATAGGSRDFGSLDGFEFRNIVRSGNPCGGGYPGRYCNAAQDSVVDEWQLYNRECVSYAAYAMQYRFGKNVPAFNGQGNAYEWPSYLSARGYTVNNTPAVGSVAIVPAGQLPYGHAMVVEAVMSDGWVHVSQFNWDVDGTYSEMDIRPTGVYFVHF